MKFESFLESGWIIKKGKKIPENPKILIGLPGMGSVAKIAADYLIEKLKLKPFMVIYSKFMPHSVIIDKDRTFKLPSFSFYKFKNKDGKEIVVLTGEAQPITEESNYEFAELVIKVFNKKIDEIISFAGRGLNTVPLEPKVFIAANNKKYLKDLEKFFKNKKEYDKSYGVSHITGLAGIIPAVSEIYNIKASTWMADTYIDPLFLGFNASYVLLKNLAEYWNFEINLKELKEEAEKIEKIIKQGEDVIKKLWEEQTKKQKEEKEILKKYYS